ncbi:FitA-like ribbon-helix-helix domain-containing protein [Wenzhouxiangella marina]|uniref:Antitoxin FitA-like ribbon-helix-helix domain-containing protein n=1 Tax=Wenzhouxiangella marina TaxID=1579979 RepID=A0A0K0Y0C5_9GAMM|nr:hypothetical protein [Wenzhouxiangella marina]AKS43316.1 hypothetical protein WM2015_2962 [Wenzhouxiangella marina]MBB6088569.1 plasmid stability protein [Wenzhouxiangella marina]
MNQSIQIHNLPETVLATLEARAIRRGQSLQEYLHQALVQLARMPTLNEQEAIRDTPIELDQPQG